jgi:hypothetical protein
VESSVEFRPGVQAAFSGRLDSTSRLHVTAAWVGQRAGSASRAQRQFEGEPAVRVDQRVAKQSPRRGESVPDRLRVDV